MSSPNFYQQSDTRAKELSEHLDSWGLRHYSDEARYYQWQKEELTEGEIAELNRLGVSRAGSDDSAADMAFYDLAAQSNTLAVLYSQRYEYFVELGSAICDRIEPARRVLDFGCGVGILTTFYARCFPHITFVGLDRSPVSIERAREEAARRGLSNVQFECRHIPNEEVSDSFDLIICTQALFQAEKDPGLPSVNWKTFERVVDSAIQVEAELRSGLKDRLDSLSKKGSPEGRMLLCEKTWHLGRRILLQRALQFRGYHLIAEPLFIHYQTIDEKETDGPIFVVSQNPGINAIPWCEEVSIEKGGSLYRLQGKQVEEFVSCMNDPDIVQTQSLEGGAHALTTVTFARWGRCLAYGVVMSRSGFQGIILGGLAEESLIHRYFLGYEVWTDEERKEAIARLWPPSEQRREEAGFPIFESHTPVAQQIWNALPQKHVRDQMTFREQDGREMHIEWGICDPLRYLYWANTYDQRQLVLMPPQREGVLQDYYLESLSEMRRGAHVKEAAQ